MTFDDIRKGTGKGEKYITQYNTTQRPATEHNYNANKSPVVNKNTSLSRP
jgi:hypothetical protein